MLAENQMYQEEPGGTVIQRVTEILQGLRWAHLSNLFPQQQPSEGRTLPA